MISAGQAHKSVWSEQEVQLLSIPRVLPPSFSLSVMFLNVYIFIKHKEKSTQTKQKPTDLVKANNDLQSTSWVQY